MPTNDHRGTVIRDHAIAIHTEMVRTSEVQSDGTILWEGSISAIFRKLDISQNYHTPIMRLLQRTDCMRQVRRGSRNISSAFVIMRDAASLSADEWPSINSIVKSNSDGLTKGDSAHILLAQRVKTLEDALQGIDIVKALSELQTQINQLKG